MITKTRLYLVAKKYKRKNQKGPLKKKGDYYYGFLGGRRMMPLFLDENMHELKGQLPE